MVLSLECLGGNVIILGWLLSKKLVVIIMKIIIIIIIILYSRVFVKWKSTYEFVELNEYQVVYIIFI